VSSEAQFVEPSVSRAKFDREINDYREFEREYRRRGWLLLRAEYPDILVALVAPQLKPAAVVTGVQFDYSNYDFRPPSVRLVNPFTEEPYKANEIPTNLKRSVEGSFPGIPGLVIPEGAQAKVMMQQPLMQAYGPDDIPFLCVAGVREYHDHPGHSGDAWELHRRTGAGRLVRLLELITKYGVQPISDYQVTLVPQVAGFIQKDVPA
jgi:Predicted metal binding domain